MSIISNLPYNMQYQHQAMKYMMGISCRHTGMCSLLLGTVKAKKNEEVNKNTLSM